MLCFCHTWAWTKPHSCCPLSGVTNSHVFRLASNSSKTNATTRVCVIFCWFSVLFFCVFEFFCEKRCLEEREMVKRDKYTRMA